MYYYYYYYYIDFGDPELRPSFGISGLQGPTRVRDKMEKERNELRDLVISTNTMEHIHSYG